MRMLMLQVHLELRRQACSRYEMNPNAKSREDYGQDQKQPE
jgi:hypothetical protein